MADHRRHEMARPRHWAVTGVLIFLLAIPVVAGSQLPKTPGGNTSAASPKAVSGNESAPAKTSTGNESVGVAQAPAAAPVARDAYSDVLAAVSHFLAVAVVAAVVLILASATYRIVKRFIV